MTRQLNDMQALFWGSLATHLAWDPMPTNNRIAALQWLGDAAALEARADARADIARALEDGILAALEISRAAGFSVHDVRPSIIPLLIPLTDGPLLRDMDDTLRRCLGFIFSLANEGRVTKTLARDDSPGSDRHIEVSEEEEELAFIDALRIIGTGRPVLNLVVGPASAVLTRERVLSDSGHRAVWDAKISLFVLMLADDQSIQPRLVNQLVVYFAMVDPSLAVKLRAAREALLGPNGAARAEALRTLAYEYVLSNHLRLRRSLGSGLKWLADAPLARFDEACGIKVPPGQINGADLLNWMLTEGTQADDIVMSSTVHTILLLHMGIPTLVPRLGETIGSAISSAKAKGSSLPEILGKLAHNTGAALNVFEGLFDFATILLSFQHVDPGAKEILVNGRALPYAECVREIITHMVGVGMLTPQEDGRAQSSYLLPANLELHRRKIHALCMRLAAWVSASPRHVQDLVAQGAEGDAVIVAWLVRSLVLTDRMLPVVMHDLGWDAEEVADHLEELVQQLGINVGADLYPDLLNPFLYGPAEYDHAVAALLSVLNTTWGYLTADQGDRRPFWWSEEIAGLLAAVAGRPATEAEKLFEGSRGKGKPNRLGIVLDRLPQDIAGELVAKGTGT